MKKLVAFVLAFICVLSLVGCNKDPVDITDEDGNNKSSEYITNEKGELYLVLPVSKKSVYVWDEQKAYLDYIDFDMLKEAEEKITEQVSQYEADACFFLQVDNDDYLRLWAEVIVDIEPPEEYVIDDVIIGGCDIDHKHLFFKERITK